MKLRLAKASQLSWSWGLAWLSLAIMMIRQGVDEKKTKSNHSNLAVKFTPLPSEASTIVPI